MQDGIYLQTQIIGALSVTHPNTQNLGPYLVILVQLKSLRDQSATYII